MKTVIWVIAVIVAISVGYSAGYQEGIKTKKAPEPELIPIPPNAVVKPDPPPHHFTFQERGASIFRFDSDTGQACWMQLSQADAGTPVPQCPQN